MIFMVPRTYAILAAAVLILAGIAVYANSFQAPFVMDGNLAIVENASIRQIWPWNFTVGRNRPLGILTFALNYAVAEKFTRRHDGYDVWGYHAVNVAIHVAAALVLFGIVRRTLSRGRLAERFSGRAGLLAFAVALLWLVHPLQTESVTFVYQRLEALMGLFYLLTLYCFVRSLDAGRPRWLWLAGSVASCVLGMATKEVMFTAPLAVLWYDRIFAASTWSELRRKRWGFYLSLAGTWGVLILLIVGSHDKYGKDGIGTGNAAGITPWQYARSEPGVILHYLRLSFWPRGQCFDYNWPVADAPAVIFWTSAALGTLLAVTILLMWKRPAWGFVAGCFFLILGPTSSFVPIVDLAFEHRMYLSLAAVVLAVVLAADAASRPIAARLSGAGRGRFWNGLAACSALGLVAGVLGWLTFLRNEDYRSAIGIYDDTVAKSPLNPRPHFCLSREYIERGNWNEAEREASLAIQLKPDYAEPYNNRANAYVELGQLDKALADYSRFIELRTDVSIVYQNRGWLYQRLGRYEEAIRDYTKSVEISPQFARSYINRAQCHEVLEQWEPLIADITELIELLPDKSPDKIFAYQRRAQAHYRARDYDAAWADIDTFRQFGGTPDPVFLRELGDLSGRRK